MDFRQFPLKIIPSPKDPRDYKIAKYIPVMESFPDEYKIPYDFLERNQGSVGECVGNGIAEFQDSLSNVTDPAEMFSESYIYGNREQNMHQGPGLIAREALKIYQKYGICKRRDFDPNKEVPEILSLYQARKTELDALAAPYKDSIYASIDTDVEIKSYLIHTGKPVIATWPIYENFYEIGRDGYYKPDGYMQGKLCGYHDMNIVGWRNDGTWIVCNIHWTRQFGDYGFCYVPYWFNQTELWAITPKKEDNMRGIIVMNTLADLPAATRLHNRYHLPMIEMQFAGEDEKNAKVKLQVGNMDVLFTPDTKRMAGVDRDVTDDEVTKFIAVHLTL